MDAPELSIIIPAWNEEACIGKTLAFLLANSSASEVLVADGGSTDRTTEICADFPGVRVISYGEPHNARQMNGAAQYAKGRHLFFLHADTQPPEGFELMIKDCLSDERNLAGSFSLTFDSQHPLLRFVSFCTRFTHPVFVYGDHGLFLSRELFFLIGGFPDQEFLEVQAMIREIRHRGRWRKVAFPVTTSSRRFLANGVFRQICIDIYIILLHVFGRSPTKLKTLYVRLSGG